MKRTHPRRKTLAEQRAVQLVGVRPEGQHDHTDEQRPERDARGRGGRVRSPAAAQLGGGKRQRTVDAT